MLQDRSQQPARGAALSAMGAMGSHVVDQLYDEAVMHSVQKRLLQVANITANATLSIANASAAVAGAVSADPDPAIEVDGLGVVDEGEVPEDSVEAAGGGMLLLVGLSALTLLMFCCCCFCTLKGTGSLPPPLG